MAGVWLPIDGKGSNIDSRKGFHTKDGINSIYDNKDSKVGKIKETIGTNTEKMNGKSNKENTLIDKPEKPRSPSARVMELDRALMTITADESSV